SGVTGSGVAQKLFKRGKGTLNLAGGNSITRLVIEDGAVYASEVADNPSLPNTVEFVKGALWDPNTMGSYSTSNINFHVGEGNSGSIYLDPRCSYTGKLTGAGTFTVYSSGPRIDLKGNWSEFEGDIIAGYYKRATYDPDFKWDNSYGMPKATLNILKDVTFNAQNYNITLGNLKGTGTYNGTGTLTIGNDEKAINYNGIFSGNPKLVKTGECDLYMGKQMTGINSLTVKQGTISLTASKSPYNTSFLTAPLTLEGEAMMRGRGTVGSITVSGNATLEPGSYSNEQHYGPIFSTGNVQIEEGATLSLYLRMAGKGNPCSYIDVKGTLTIDGTVNVTMNPAYTPQVGDEFQLWITNSFSGAPKIELPELPEGLAWDFTGLQDASGLLKVVEGTGVSLISGDSPVICTVYDVAGIRIGSFESTKTEATEAAKRELNLSSGLYILVMEANGYTETIKLQL
ncbi:MAG: T9SS type A sorting domain-containing protein, partial [Muribaculaceae bacterium]|nr:T9SS type A sorting domain-containing protein [Muribaculaceae bacterium]